MRLFAVLFIFIFALQSNLAAQNIAAFSDYQNRFFVFDSGKFKQLEHLPILSQQTGNNCVGYLTNNNHLKIYSKGIDYEISPFVTDFFVTDNIVVYKTKQQLYVFDKGKRTLLTKFSGSYYYGDSIVGYYDKENYLFQVYYNGKIYPLADGLLKENISSFKAGGNIVGFIDNYNVFKVFYRGNVYELLTVNNKIAAKFGMDIVAFVDMDTDNFQCFFKGKIIDLDSFAPKQFKVGHSKIAYITDLGDFKLFDNGEIYDISSYAPYEFRIYEDLIVYNQNDQFFAFYNGKEFLIENYIPNDYKCKYGLIAYINQNGNLCIFNEGKKETLSYENINSFDVSKDIVIYNCGMNTTKIHSNGKSYSN